MGPAAAQRGPKGAGVSTVNVVVWQRGMPCLADRGSRPAELWIQSERFPRMHYCTEDTARRIWVHQRHNRGIEATDAARAILNEVAV